MLRLDPWEKNPPYIFFSNLKFNEELNFPLGKYIRFPNGGPMIFL